MLGSSCFATTCLDCQLALKQFTKGAEARLILFSACHIYPLVQDQIEPSIAARANFGFTSLRIFSNSLF
jgi:hypothetical protein